MNRTLVSVLVCMSLALPVSAQTTPAELERRLREIEARIEALAAGSPTREIAELRQQIEILSREIEALKLETAPAAEPETPERQFGLGRAASKVYRSRSGVSLGGYGEMLYENFAAERDSGVASDTKDQLDFIRAVLYTGYKWSDRIVFNSELEVEHATTSGQIGEVSLEFGYLDFLIDPRFNIRAGLLLMPVGLVNELHEPTAFLGAKRPEVERLILPATWRETGVGAHGELGDLSYRAYLVTGLRSRDFSSSGIRAGRQRGARALAEDFAFTGRLDWTPLEGALLGGSLYRGDSAQGDTTPSGERFGGTVTIAEFHGDLKVRGLSLRGLWAKGSIDDVAEINAANGLTGSSSVGDEFAGWYAEAGYDLGNVFPRLRASITPFLRYEELDTQESVPRRFSRNPAREVDIMTIGFAIKPIDQVVVKIDHQNAGNAGGSGVDQWNVSLGYIF